MNVAATTTLKPVAPFFGVQVIKVTNRPASKLPVAQIFYFHFLVCATVFLLNTYNPAWPKPRSCERCCERRRERCYESRYERLHKCAQGLRNYSGNVDLRPEMSATSHLRPQLLQSALAPRLSHWFLPQ